MESIYDLLGVSQDATAEEIGKAYDKKVDELKDKRNNGEIETSEFITKLGELGDAVAILVDADRRKAYDKGHPVNSTGATEGTKEEKSNSILKKIALGTCIVALAVSIVGCSVWGLGKLAKKNDNQQNQNPISTIETTTGTTDGETQDQDPNETEDQDQNQTQDQNQAPVVPSDVPEMVNYGDAKDDALLTERATKLLDELNASNVYNIGTNAPYTIDELKTIIQYMNGAYKPQNEDEAYTLINEYLNFVIASSDTDQIIYAIQYQGGEDSFKDTVQSYSNNFKPINIVDNMLFGNSSTYPYLKWFESQYYAMICTTDREECARIYDSMVQSLADMVYGDGFTLDGKVYKEQDFLGLDRVNSGNILQLLVYSMEPFRTTLTKDTFTVHNKFLSANPDENTATVEYDQIMPYFNMDCEDDLQKIAVDDEGLLLIDNPDGKNFHYINQVNTINRALMEYYGKNNAYENVYQKSLN